MEINNKFKKKPSQLKQKAFLDGNDALNVKAQITRPINACMMQGFPRVKTFDLVIRLA